MGILHPDITNIVQYVAIKLFLCNCLYDTAFLIKCNAYTQMSLHQPWFGYCCNA